MDLGHRERLEWISALTFLHQVCWLPSTEHTLEADHAADYGVTCKVASYVKY